MNRLLLLLVPLALACGETHSGGADSGAVDAADADSGRVRDTEPADASMVDSSMVDSSMVDSSISDSGPVDSGIILPADTGLPVDAGGPDTRVPPSDDCPRGPSIPDPDGFMGACCYRAWQGDDLANPEFRMAAIRPNTPRTLANVVVRGVLNSAMDDERFNWLIKVEGARADGDVLVRTGNGTRRDDGSFEFGSGDAPGPGDRGRWDPVSLPGTLAGENVTTRPTPSRFTVAVLDERGDPALEFPFRNPQVQALRMSEDRSCVGVRTGSIYSTMDGELTAYITIEDADAYRLEVSVIRTSLCNFIRGGESTESLSCTAFPQSSWALKPDAFCDADGACEVGDCDPNTDCNAWSFEADFAAHGVEID